MHIKTLPRRTLLRGASVCLALPFLDIMRPRQAVAQANSEKHFFALFYPNGTDPRIWHPQAGPLTEDTLSEALQVLAGFDAEGIWPAGGPVFEDITTISGIDHSGVSVEIHQPSMSLAAHRGTKNSYTPSAATLDQYLADRIGEDTPYRHLALSSTGDRDISQGNISFDDDGQTAAVERSPQKLFETLFSDGVMSPNDTTLDEIRARQSSILDYVRSDAKSLQNRIGAADKQRVEQYLTSIFELEKQVNAEVPSGCAIPDAPTEDGGWHEKSKQFIDLGVLAMSCGLTRVVSVQYSNSWDVGYSDYTLGEGRESVGSWSDHFLSHKLDDNDRATDLDGLDRGEATRIANLRVLNTSRFKARRFAYLVQKLKDVPTANGTLYDDSMAMYISENGDGDSHARKEMPILLAGGVGGFQTGRSVAVKGNTGDLHASILGYFGLEVPTYGNPAGSPLSEI